MPRGGRRENAGRKAGSKDSSPRRRRQNAPIIVAPNPDGPPHGGIEWLKKARAAGREAMWLDMIEKDAIAKNDIENLKWLAAWGGSNLDGLPAKRPEPQPEGKDFREILREASERARQHIEQSRKEYLDELFALRKRVAEYEKGSPAPAPAGKPLISAAPGGRPALPPGPAPLEPEVLAPEPVLDEKEREVQRLLGAWRHR